MNLTVQQAALAWARGKMVEAKAATHDGFQPVAPVGTDNGCWSGRVFGEGHENYDFRLAPGETMEEAKLETPVDDGPKPISIGDAVKAWADMKRVEACVAGELYVYRKPITSPFGANNEASEWSPNIFTEPGRFTFYLGAGETLDAKPSNQPSPVDDGGPARDMSLRQHYAGLAMQGLCANPRESAPLDFIAVLAVNQADALLAELRKA